MSNIEQNKREKYTPDWFREKAKSEEYADVDKKAEEARQKFLERFSPEKLEKLDGNELLNTIFLSPENKKKEPRDYLFYYIEHYPGLNLFGGAPAGNDIFYGLSSDGDGNWISGMSKKNSKRVSQEEAINIGIETRDKIVNGAKVIQEFRRESPLEEVYDYEKLNEKLIEATDNLINERIWIRKYYGIVFFDAKEPNKNIFAPFYSEGKQKEVIKAISKTVDETKSLVARMGQICLYAKECGISPVLFHKIYNDNSPKENDQSSEQKSEETEINENCTDYKNEYTKKLLASKNLIFHGAPGTGKTYLAKQIAADIISGGSTNNFDSLSDAQKKQMGFVQFHPGYDYSDFVEGLRPTDKDGAIGFTLCDGIFKAFVDRAREDKSNNYVFIIDEINRGEISKIFGELFFSVDPNYRGETGAVTTQYANLHTDPNKKFYIPNNVYLIGTMNDIDRSVDSFDFAMRRRFRFIELKADENLEMLDSLKKQLKKEAIERMENLNRAIEQTEDLNRNYQIGAAYFLKLGELVNDSDDPSDASEAFETLWKDYLEPLLHDYIQGMPNEKETMEQFKNAYDGDGDANGTDQNHG